MQTIEIQFPAQRYHATPWDAHVNEGRVEWPPCPWRLLRALIAAGYSKLGWHETPPPTAQSLIEKLATVAPQYVLPKSTAAHTRHYMPYTEGKNEKKTKVFDTFLKMLDSNAKMLIRYDVTLDEDERDLLTELTMSLAYLGRAESWVEAKLLTGDDPADVDDATWISLAETGAVRRNRLLAPLDSNAFLEWRNREAESAATMAEANAEKAAIARDINITPAQRKRARTKAQLPYPVDLVSALQQENPTWQKAGWPRPPGSQWLDYELPEQLFDRQPLSTIPTNRPFSKPTAILLSIDGEGKRGILRPSMKRALPLMELLHSEAIRYAAQDLNPRHLPELTGTAADGKQLSGPHTHAHWLPLSLYGEGKIDHVLIFATSGFSHEAIQAVSRIRWAYAKGIQKLSVNTVGRGDMASISQQLSALSKIDRQSVSILRPSDNFVSATPLVLRKYLSRRGKKTLEGQIYEELLERGYPDPASVERISDQEMVRLKLKGFLLRRKSGKQQPRYERSWAVRIRFNETISHCPITLGYASHFGLGMFRAEDDS